MATSFINRNRIFVPSAVHDAVNAASDEPFERLIRDETDIKNGARMAALLPEGFKRLFESDYGRSLLTDRFWRLANLYYFRHIEDKSPVLVDWQEPYLKELYSYIFTNPQTLNTIILKTRQVYVTTAVCCMMLDLCCFSDNQECGISNFNLDDVKDTFRDKVMFALNNSLIVQMQKPTARSTSLIFDRRKSVLQVEQTGRGRTMSFMHMTEFALTCLMDEAKAEEMIRGMGAATDFSPSIIESSSQGPGGLFHQLCMDAYELKKKGAKLDRTQYQFLFVAWWQKWRNKLEHTAWEDDLLKYAPYFEKIENENNTIITPQQRNWWVSELHRYGKDERILWQEYPSTVEEAFQANDEAFIMQKSMAELMRDGRYLPLNGTEQPVLCFWDFGWGDSTAFALFQMGRGGYVHCIYSYKENQERLPHFFSKLNSLNYNVRWHVLPHDAIVENSAVSQKLTETAGSIDQYFRNAGFHNLHKLSRQSDKRRGFLASKEFAPHVKICSHRAKSMYDSLMGVRRKYNNQFKSYEDKLSPHSVHNHLYDCFEAAAYVHNSNHKMFEPISLGEDMIAEAEAQKRQEEENGATPNMFLP